MRWYRTKGVCARAIGVETDGKTVGDVVIVGGCRGQANALPRLVKGRDIDDVVERLRGVGCRYYEDGTTSCGDQLARILEQEKALAGKAREKQDKQ